MPSSSNLRGELLLSFTAGTFSFEEHGFPTADWLSAAAVEIDPEKLC
jgi:hypothetical protein